MRLKDYILLARPYQWYKNLVIFLAIVFAGNLLEINDLALTLAGFLALSLVSSGNYVINDIFDKDKDRIHPQKRKRSIAAGKIAVHSAILYAAALLLSGFLVAGLLSVYFLLMAIVLAFSTLLYSLWLKDIPFLDVTLIGTNFVIRSIAGAFVIGVAISAWLVICTFLLALLLAFAKRNAEKKALKDAQRHKPVLKFYSEKVLSFSMHSSAMLLLASFLLYSLLRQPPIFLMIYPFAAYGILRFLALTKRGADVSRDPIMFIYDSKLLFTGTMTSLLILVILYA